MFSKHLADKNITYQILFDPDFTAEDYQLSILRLTNSYGSLDVQCGSHINRELWQHFVLNLGYHLGTLIEIVSPMCGIFVTYVANDCTRSLQYWTS